MILLEQTNRCNLHCVGCPNRLHVRPAGHMSMITMSNILVQLKGKLDERLVIHEHNKRA